MAGRSDYGKLGHAEAVGLRVPPASLGEFAEVYFALFDDNGNRADQLGDKGLEYRNVVGLPGGRTSPLVPVLLKATLAQGDKVDFATGKGGDADARAVVWIMDSAPAKFPLYRAENYHQFHDGFARGENYPDEYNRLTNELDLDDTSCPAF